MYCFISCVLLKYIVTEMLGVLHYFTGGEVNVGACTCTSQCAPSSENPTLEL